MKKWMDVSLIIMMLSIGLYTLTSSSALIYTTFIDKDPSCYSQPDDILSILA